MRQFRAAFSVVLSGRKTVLEGEGPNGLARQKQDDQWPIMLLGVALVMWAVFGLVMRE